ncbi:glycogen debranching enzyme, putative [Xenococcus sp. PCC 7305]|uniref:amylo-alpha-1,6-glucosidase n=1 Tax=Xenococcus sp. PCC 7305 TaxID=102125 RepID=UPI0002ACF23C|nr:amylo-alpha-1,6-glucosidase [Xenococcus sp. PCC 7305]ELS01868.1 glycogen debranching enzyme, putative [Xenococcus sp. PCC 7305]
MSLKFGREICSNFEISQSREWLVTNGIGGYASGAIAGGLTRRYHGLLVAALKPPVARTLLLTKLDETVQYNTKSYDLYTNSWADGTIAPHGYLNIENFYLAGTTAVWNYAFADGLLEKRIWMQHGANTTYIRYSFLRGTQPLNLSLKALVNYRDYHNKTEGSSLFSVDHLGEQSLKIRACDDAASLYLFATQENQTNNFSWEINNNWYRNLTLAVEKYRGLDEVEDHLNAATGKVTLQPGEAITIVASTENTPQLDSKVSLQEKNNRESKLLNLWYFSNFLAKKPHPRQPKDWVEQLVLAADQFIVDRPLTDNPKGKTIIAGYPWFTDWGRDTMIALPGLTLSTGRYEIAKTILLTFAKHLDQGMLPNMFPDAGSTPEYNTVDATLWYFEAIQLYYAATKDQEFLAKLFPLLAEIIDWHLKGTRYNIHLDDDGLLYAGEEGVQLTWMDAKVGDWVVTPRIGKPIEVNALWYNALVCMMYFAQVLGKSGSKYQELATRARSHFSKFWYEAGGYCYDVIDSPEGNDPSFRPNQIFAVSLPSIEAIESEWSSPLQKSQQKMVVDKVSQILLTSSGLRSLDPNDPDYVGIYGGNQLQRDGSYHQGTTWSWLIGHFIQAHLRVYNNPELARSFIEPMADHLQAGCIGSISEIFDGDAPFTPRGCFAQAWSVAEVLRSWLLVNK